MENNVFGKYMKYDFLYFWFSWGFAFNFGAVLLCSNYLFLIPCVIFFVLALIFGKKCSYYFDLIRSDYEKKVD